MGSKVILGKGYTGNTNVMVVFNSTFYIIPNYEVFNISKSSETVRQILYEYTALCDELYHQDAFIHTHTACKHHWRYWSH